MKQILTKTPAFAICFVLSCSMCVAQWSSNPSINNAVTTAFGDQRNVSVASDGSNGAIVTWMDSRNGSWDIYAQRINSNGVVQWTANGVPICTLANDQLDPVITADGNGGAIIGWYGTMNNTHVDIYAQKINASGAVQWTAGGVAICTAADYQQYPKIISDGSGGAILTWEDYRGWATSGLDIYAQRVNSAGVVQWTANGAPICTADYGQSSVVLTTDGSGGAVIAWKENRDGQNTYYDIYAQRINGSGVVQWIADGVSVCSELENQANPKIASDGSNGAIVTWADWRNNSNFDVYAQRINGSGTAMWTLDGVAICLASNDQEFPTIASDGNNGAIITWGDFRNGTINSDIYAQRVNGSGVVQWTSNGQPICTVTGNQEDPAVISDGSGGAVITWGDLRIANTYDIYAQRINASGANQWLTDGALITNANNLQELPVLVPSGSGGAIITWHDRRGNVGNQYYDVYAQRILPSGLLCNNPVTVNLGTNITQCAAPLVLNAGNPGSTYLWSTNATTQTITVTATGNYSVTVTSNGGCSDVDTITITMTPLPTVSYNDTHTSVCLNAAPFTLTPGTPAGGTYSGPGVSGNTFTPSVAGVGTKTVVYSYTNASGCTGTDPSTIVVDPCTGIAAGFGGGSINFAPNPSNGLVTFNADEKVTEIALLNSLGETVCTLRTDAITGTLDLQHLADGIYFYVAVSEWGIVSTGKLLLAK